MHVTDVKSHKHAHIHAHYGARLVVQFTRIPEFSVASLNFTLKLCQADNIGENHVHGQALATLTLRLGGRQALQHSVRTERVNT